MPDLIVGQRVRVRLPPHTEGVVIRRGVKVRDDGERRAWCTFVPASDPGGVMTRWEDELEACEPDADAPVATLAALPEADDQATPVASSDPDPDGSDSAR